MNENLSVNGAALNHLTIHKNDASIEPVVPSYPTLPNYSLGRRWHGDLLHVVLPVVGEIFDDHVVGPFVESIDVRRP